MDFTLLRRGFLFVPPFAVVASVAVVAQPTPPAGGVKAHKFDVVSIKPTAAGESMYFKYTPTGYSSAGFPIRFFLSRAFLSGNWSGKIVGAPDWVDTQQFDIEAKVAEADVAEWQKERYQLVQPLLQQMLQAMLADRCKLVVHRVHSETTGYEIVVDKRGAKLTAAAPEVDAAIKEQGTPLPGGGYVVGYRRSEVPHLRFYGVTMAAFAAYLDGWGGGQLADQTGLTGRYDFTLNSIYSGPDGLHVDNSSPDPDRLSHWDFGALGLKVKQVKLATEDLVIDHIERPSAN